MTAPARLVDRFRGYLPVAIDVETGGFDWNRLTQGLASLSLFAQRRLFDLRHGFADCRHLRLLRRPREGRSHRLR